MTAGKCTVTTLALLLTMVFVYPPLLFSGQTKKDTSQNIIEKSDKPSTANKQPIKKNKKLSVYCCKKGSIIRDKMTRGELKKNSDTCSTSKSKVQSHCGFCCTDGKTSPVSSSKEKNSCRKKEGRFLSKAGVCRPADVYCCIKGKVKKTSPEECRRNKGKGYATLAEVQRQCRPAAVYCCIKGKVKKTSLGECRKNKVKDYARAVEAQRNCSGQNKQSKRDRSRISKERAALSNKAMLGNTQKRGQLDGPRGVPKTQSGERAFSGQDRKKIGGRRMSPGAGSVRYVTPNHTVAGRGAEYQGDGSSLADFPLRVPKTLDDRAYGQDFGKFQPDLKEPLKTPLPEGVDSEKIHRPGDSAGNDYVDWFFGGMEEDINHDAVNDLTPEAMEQERRRQRENQQRAREREEEEWENFWNRVRNLFGGSKNGSKEKGNKAGNDVDKPGNDNKPSAENVDKIKVAIEAEEVKKDPNPEGDDPDKLRSSAMLGGNPTEGRGGRGDIPGRQSEDDLWSRHKMEIQGRGGVDPEGEGGPDESQSEGMGKDRLKQVTLSTGVTASPSDGGQGDPDNPIPPGPAFSESPGQSKRSSGETHMQDTGVSMSPTPEEPDNPDGPSPGPEF